MRRAGLHQGRLQAQADPGGPQPPGHLAEPGSRGATRPAGRRCRRWRGSTGWPALKPGASALLVHPTARTEAGEPAPGAGGDRRRQGAHPGPADRHLLALGLPGRRRRRRRPHLPALLGERHPLAGARSGPDAAAGGAGPGRVPAGPARHRPRAHPARRLHPGQRRRRCSWRCYPAGNADGRAKPLRTFEVTTNKDGEAHLELPGAGGRRLPPGRAGRPSTAAPSPRSRPSSSGPRAASWRTSSPSGRSCRRSPR